MDTTSIPHRDDIVVAVLDLHMNSVIGMDGQSLVLKREDFVGFYRIPVDSGFHLLTVRAGSSKQDRSSSGVSAVTVGFVIPSSNGTSLVRKFDPQTEEVSDQIDELTETNLVSEIRNNRLGPQQVVTYSQVVSAEALDSWKKLTSFVSQTLLLARGLSEGSKIVPGSYGEEEEPTSSRDESRQSPRIVDGLSIRYPPVPVFSRGVSIRHSSHAGTKRFLEGLSPSERTSLFMNASPPTLILRLTLSRYYKDQWNELLGDLQLSYLLFLHLHCFASLSHWRDLIAMLSMVERDGVSAYTELFAGLLSVLESQVLTMERDFLDDAELAGDNFFVLALRRLLSTFETVSKSPSMKETLSRFSRLLQSRFPTQFKLDEEIVDEIGQPGAMDMEEDEDDEDGPVTLPSEDIEASLKRLSTGSQRNADNCPLDVRQRFPLLVAAMSPNEDIVMTCARALDDALDVSLVREAAAYLEAVEAYR